MSSHEIKDDPERLPWLGRKLLFLEKMKNVDRVVYALYGVCALLVLADFFYKKKYYVSVENITGFYAFYGFFLCAALVLGARTLRLFLKRNEDFYAPYDVEAEEYPEDGLERKEHGDV